MIRKLITCSLFGTKKVPNLKHSCIFLIGTYVCSKCDHELFGSQSKYKHETPWPAFSQTKHENSLSKKLESKGAFKVRKNVKPFLFVCLFFHSLAFNFFQLLTFHMPSLYFSCFNLILLLPCADIHYCDFRCDLCSWNIVNEKK